MMTAAVTMAPSKTPTIIKRRFMVCVGTPQIKIDCMGGASGLLWPPNAPEGSPHQTGDISRTVQDARGCTPHPSKYGYGGMASPWRNGGRRRRRFQRCAKNRPYPPRSPSDLSLHLGDCVGSTRHGNPPNRSLKRPSSPVSNDRYRLWKSHKGVGVPADPRGGNAGGAVQGVKATRRRRTGAVGHA